MAETEKRMAPVVRTSAGLRDALFDELDRLRNGETNAARANAVARLSDQVCSTVQLELDVQRYMQKLPNERPASSGLPSLSLSADR